MYAAIIEWWSGISLRTKITGVTVLLLTVGLLIAGVGTMYAMRSFLVGDVDDRVTAAARQAAASSPCTSGSAVDDSPTEFIVVLLDDAGDITCANPEWEFTEDRPRLTEVDAAFAERTEGQPFSERDAAGRSEWRLVATPFTDTTTGQELTKVVGLTLENTNRVVARMFTIFFLFGIVVVVLGAASTRFLVGSTFGPLRQVEKTAAAIAEGDFGQRLGGATPNTEVGRLNRSLNMMLNRIDRALADRARTIEQMRRFVGDASHELRTPLVSVRGYAELYRMGALASPDAVGQAMDRIEKEAVRMGGLVEDLLALARLDERRPMQLSTVDLRPLAHDAAMDARAQQPKRTVRVLTSDPSARGDAVVDSNLEDVGRSRGPVDITTTGPIAFAGATLARLRRRSRASGETTEDEAVAETDAVGEEQGVEPLVRGEENKIRQLIANLIGNAERYTPDDSPLEIAVWVDQVANRAVVDIVDHGDGIPPEIRDKIFQRFWRADTSRTRDTGGSGLGLAIVSSIVSAHKGTVGIHETPGGGATFRVTFPLLPRDRTFESDAESSAAASAPASR